MNLCFYSGEAYVCMHCASLSTVTFQTNVSMTSIQWRMSSMWINFQIFVHSTSVQFDLFARIWSGVDHIHLYYSKFLLAAISRWLVCHWITQWNDYNVRLEPTEREVNHFGALDLHQLLKIETICVVSRVHSNFCHHQRFSCEICQSTKGGSLSLKIGSCFIFSMAVYIQLVATRWNLISLFCEVLRAYWKNHSLFHFHGLIDLPS